MARLLGTIRTQNFDSDVWEDETGRVYFTADADIDADGANGLNGEPAAYRSDDTGSDALANGGMRIDKASGRVVFAKGHPNGVAIADANAQPMVLANGVIPSMTWYSYPGRSAQSPDAYLDAAVVPYVVVPPLVVHATAGIVRGCRARVSYTGDDAQKRTLDCVVGDLSADDQIGEISIAAARALGIDPSPRAGGRAQVDVLYEIWPGVAFPGFTLQPA